MMNALIIPIYIIVQLLFCNEVSCYTLSKSKNSLLNHFSIRNDRLSDSNNIRLHTATSSNNAIGCECEGYSARDSFNLIVLGDLHLETENMKIFEEARSDCTSIVKDISLIPCPPLHAPPQSTSSKNINIKTILENISNTNAGDLSIEQLEMLLLRKKQGPLMNCHVVSLGDLGRKDIRHEQGDPGTTKSFDDAKTFLDGFDIPYELVTGNHDLEGLDEFATDEDNLNAWLQCFGKNTSHFSKLIGERTLLVGLSTVRFRDSPYSSHECHVDDKQLEWFQNVIESHPAEDGWNICVFSHAPIMGSGLRVLQNVHVINGCAWLNHCSTNRNAFIQTVQNNPQIKLWFSGHFHLSHDHQDSIFTFGNCTFVQVGVIGPISSRDGRRQTRLIRGSSQELEIYTINHHKRIPHTGIGHESAASCAELRLDVKIDLNSGHAVSVHAYDDYCHDNWFKAYIPQEEDGCYIEIPDGQISCQQSAQSSYCWWHMSDGAVLGLHEGQLVEYDRETLAPLGIVVSKTALDGREVLVIAEGTVLVLVGCDGNEIEVIHPNEDGISYWRKFQRNKRVRQEEKAREAVAKLWLSKTK